MPDTLQPNATVPRPLSELVRRDSDLNLADLIRRERKPLPPHDLVGCNYRAWAAAVLQAEVDHRDRDFTRVEAKLGISLDRWADPCLVQMGQFRHEARAGEALVWLSHLQTHDSDRHGPWARVRWAVWGVEEKRAWVRRRRYLLRGFIRAVEAYRAARAEIDAPAIKAAA